MIFSQVFVPTQTERRDGFQTFHHFGNPAPGLGHGHAEHVRAERTLREVWEGLREELQEFGGEEPEVRQLRQQCPGNGETQPGTKTILKRIEFIELLLGINLFEINLKFLN